MAAKIRQVLKSLQEKSDAIENTYNKGVIDGFDKKPETERSSSP